jgi:1-acyl-sn-glycerol-3-phosphate acyltransferase
VIEVLEGAPKPVKYFERPSSNTAPMYVANHASWMDIPYMGAAIGWRNYKIVAKAEVRIVRSQEQHTMFIFPMMIS